VINRPPSMKDVAVAAGVSQATVSLVLNNVPGSGISEATKQRVGAAAIQMGYRQNHVARSLKLQRSDTIGFVSDEITTTPYAFGLIQGAQEACRQAGKQLLIANVSGADDSSREVSEERAVVGLLERRVDGIIFASMSQRELEIPSALHEVPSVLVHVHPVDGSLAAITPDERAAASEACALLLDAGHVNLVHLSPRVSSMSARLRRDGFVDALTDRGIPIEEETVVAAEDSTPGAFAVALDLLGKPSHPTAFFCFDDEMAWGVYQAAAARGLSVPGDVSVVGFKNVPLIAPVLRPGLTTVALPHYTMAEWAVAYLLDGRTDIVREMVPCPMVVRGSIGSRL
jgi:LacI family transcriptional regulator